jgi:hypothetical protein
LPHLRIRIGRNSFYNGVPANSLGGRRHTPIKPDLLGFPGIGALRDHVITRFASFGIRAWLH